MKYSISASLFMCLVVLAKKKLTDYLLACISLWQQCLLSIVFSWFSDSMQLISVS